MVLSEVPPFYFRAVCLLLGGVGMLALAGAGGVPLRVPAGQWNRVLWLSAFNIAGWNGLIVLGVSLLWGGFVWAGLLAFPFLIATLLPRRSPSGVGSTPQTLWTAGNGPRPPVSVEHVDPPRQLPGRG